MPYWEITPHATDDCDSTAMPAENDSDHHAALTYAKERLESLWDSLAHEDGPRTVTIQLHKGEMPELEDGA